MDANAVRGAMPWVQWSSPVEDGEGLSVMTGVDGVAEYDACWTAEDGYSVAVKLSVFGLELGHEARPTAAEARDVALHDVRELSRDLGLVLVAGGPCNVNGWSATQQSGLSGQFGRAA